MLSPDAPEHLILAMKASNICGGWRAWVLPIAVVRSSPVTTTGCCRPGLRNVSAAAALCGKIHTAARGEARTPLGTRPTPPPGSCCQGSVHSMVSGHVGRADTHQEVELSRTQYGGVDCLYEVGRTDQELPGPSRKSGMHSVIVDHACGCGRLSRAGAISLNSSDEDHHVIKLAQLQEGFTELVRKGPVATDNLEGNSSKKWPSEATCRGLARWSAGKSGGPNMRAVAGGRRPICAASAGSTGANDPLIDVASCPCQRQGPQSPLQTATPLVDEGARRPVQTADFSYSTMPPCRDEPATFNSARSPTSPGPSSAEILRTPTCNNRSSRPRQRRTDTSVAHSERSPIN